ncbi:SGNH/GDSL hydrolase family protein [Lactiplantibacillus modestisalitolerans]|uniref:SGNH/GDSL hydrolase family protein n=1 Tax=Lactiplantibacillus modestisalitolerans TaxID=1457219 RepID=A0ABV5WSN7_9LACO|nr:SGNH/GDSL hydrolase family protein [Lactiplantibacillus modestisalitolerans]
MQYQTTTANNPLMPAYFLGRWAVKIIDGTRVMYSTNLGAEMWTQVTNAQFVRLSLLDLAADLPSWVALQIDGLPYQRYAVTAAPITVTLDGRPHVLRLVLSGNTDEDLVWQGTAGFAVKSLTTDGQLTPVLPGRRSMTLIGDSITAGCWVAGRQPGEDYRAEQNYAAVACDLLNARDVRIAYSAAGLSKPGTGGVPPLPYVLTALDAQTPWQPAPTDVVVINVGTNDGRIRGPEFAQQLTAFINQVQLAYPNSRLAVMIPFNQRFDRVIRQVVSHFTAVTLIETVDWQPALTDHVHPNLAGSQVAGARLARALTMLMPQVFKRD